MKKPLVVMGLLAGLLCRASSSAATCSDQVTFVAEAPTKVCIPPP